MGNQDDFEDPALDHIEESEIQAVVDTSLKGPDGVSRPICINQDDNLICLTIQDTKRLSEFLLKSIKFLEEYEKIIIQ